MKRRAVHGPGVIGIVAGLIVACQAVAPTIDFGACVWNAYGQEPAGTPIPQVIADITLKCGGDAASIIASLDQKEPRALHATTAHAGSADGGAP